MGDQKDKMLNNAIAIKLEEIWLMRKLNFSDWRGWKLPLCSEGTVFYVQSQDDPVSVWTSENINSRHIVLYILLLLLFVNF